MQNDKLTRAYLETLSFSDLVILADNYGIDVPENLNRSFLIAELIEVTEELEKIAEEPEMVVTDEEAVIPEDPNKLPDFYNSTEVEILLRNPAWAFVYWNISESDIQALSKGFITQLMLRVCSFSEKDQQNPDDAFNIQISMDDREQYVLLPAGKQYFRIDLLCSIDDVVDILASSNVLEMPEGTTRLANIHPGKVSDMSKIMELSGMKELLFNQYENHRESFS